MSCRNCAGSVMTEGPANAKPTPGHPLAQTRRMSFRKILCALDFSETSTEALRVAVRLANEDGSELVIAHAWYLDPTAFAGEYFYPAALIDELTADAKRALAETTKQAESWGATKVSSVLHDGPPWQQIVGLAERTPAIDLIVAGPRGRTGLAQKNHNTKNE